MKIKLTVNGELRVREVHPMKRLLDVLREDIQLKGAKEGCGEGECGSCAVIMNGRLVNSCMVSALKAYGSEILTIEGLGCSVAPDALQSAFVEEGAIHCGFCTPGMIIAARALLEREQNPSLEDIKTALSGNLCRCTGYEKIYRAINKAVNAGYSKGIKPFSAKTSNDIIPELNDEESKFYFLPRSLAEALEILKKMIPDLKIIAGGTDVYPCAKSNKIKLGSVMDISYIPEFREIAFEKKYIKIGSCVTNSEMMENYVLEKNCSLITQAASKCGSVAVQNMATLGGNIVTASGESDMITALLALDAEVKIVDRKHNETLVPIEKFVDGYRSTIIKRDELIKEVLIPLSLTKNKYEAFYKRGLRGTLTLSRVSIACSLEKNMEGRVSSARIAVGSMSPIPMRLSSVERMLVGVKLDEGIADSAAKKAGSIVTPRKESAYRKKVTENLVRKFILSCID